MNEQTPPQRIGTETSVSLEQGQLFIRNYNEFMQEYPYPDDVSRTVACHIARKDLFAMMGEFCSDGIRCYFGKRYDARVGQDVFCLVMVGTRFVDGVYYDIIKENGGDDCGVYEFTTPCPDTCDVTSPLYQATGASCDQP
jgi:hypothetical protein